MKTIFTKKSSRSNQLMLICLLSLGSMLSCTNSNTTVDEKVKPAPQQQQDNSVAKTDKKETIEAQDIEAFSVPALEFETSREQVEQSFKNAIKAFEKEISDAKKEGKKMTVLKVDNTPVTIWSKDGNPVKVVIGVKDDKGKFSNTLMYYLDGNKPWYAEDHEYRYIYNNDIIKYRMDEKWQAGRIRLAEFIQRKKDIKQSIEDIIVTIN